MENKNKKSEKNEKEYKWLKNSLRVIIGLLIVIIIILLLRSCGTSEPSVSEYTKTYFDLTEDSNAVEGEREKVNQSEKQAELNEKVAMGMINISMNLNPTFENGASEGNLLIVNEEINHYPQVVEIYRKDTEELIYKSGLIPVGSRVDTAKLSVDLDKGVYSCLAYFNAVDGETGELKGRAGAEVTVTVKN